MKSKHFPGIVWAYLMSITFWSGISLLMGWQYGPLNRQNLWSSFGVRACSLALWTPPIFFLVGKYVSFSSNRLRSVLLSGIGAVPFVLLQTGLIWALMPPPYDDV